MKKNERHIFGIIIIAVIIAFLMACDDGQKDNGIKWSLKNPPAIKAQLTKDEWNNGSIYTAGGEVWYSFKVTKGTTYQIWINDSYHTQSSYNASTVLMAYFSNGMQVWREPLQNTCNTPGKFTANANDTVYINISIKSSNNIGTFSIAYSSSNIKPNLPSLTGTVSISGTAIVGQTLTANTSSLGGTGTISSYEWKRGTTSIGTNSSTYIVQSADVGSTITVTVKRTDNSGSVTSSATTSVTLPPLTGTVSISRTAVVGQTLTANTYSLGGTGTISYQWKRGTTDVGTNNNTYIVQSADVGSTITVTVTRSGYTGSVTSPATTDVTLPLLTGTVSISGTAIVGQTLTANTYSLDGTETISYQWKRGTTNIGTNNNTYIVQSADVGSTITVTVTRDNYSGSVTSPGIVISSSSSSGTQSNPYTLTAGQWANGSITTASGEVWYSFSVTNGTTYHIWWNDSYEGNWTKSGDVAVSAQYSGLTTWIFGGIDTTVDDGWSTAQSFTANRTGTVLIRVIPYNRGSSNTGTFGVVYSTSSTRPVP